MTKERIVKVEEEMTLRDYFAGQALLSVATADAIKGYHLTPDIIADIAYKRADAMLIRREMK